MRHNGRVMGSAGSVPRSSAQCCLFIAGVVGGGGVVGREGARHCRLLRTAAQGHILPSGREKGPPFAWRFGNGWSPNDKGKPPPVPLALGKKKKELNEKHAHVARRRHDCFSISKSGGDTSWASWVPWLSESDKHRLIGEKRDVNCSRGICLVYWRVN